MNENPYSPPKSEVRPVTRTRVRSRIWWFIIPTVIGVFIGANALAGLFGTSPGDPLGAGLASIVGGFVGLIAGWVRCEKRIARATGTLD